MMEPLGDLEAMALAAKAGHQARFVSAPNPSVGAVLVRDGHVIGTGHTQAVGGPHAEVMAIREVIERGQTPEGATLYVTLEPCAHTGRTPPCADLIVKSGIRRVVYAWQDPYPLVSGRGHQKLEEAGIEVVAGVGKPLCWPDLRGFFSRIIKKRPWVQVKVATTLDGRTALPNGQSFWITGEKARERVQFDRAESEAIITGVGTVLADKPRLTVRLPGMTKVPYRVILDPEGKTPPDAAILGDDSILVVASLEAMDRTVGMPGQRWCLPGNHPGAIDLDKLLMKLAGLGVNNVHVEAGAVTLGRFLEADLVDSLVVYQAPALFGQGLPLAQMNPPLSPGEATRWIREGVETLGDDLRLSFVHPTRIRK